MHTPDQKDFKQRRLWQLNYAFKHLFYCTELVVVHKLSLTEYLYVGGLLSGFFQSQGRILDRSLTAVFQGCYFIDSRRKTVPMSRILWILPNRVLRLESFQRCSWSILCILKAPTILCTRTRAFFFFKKCRIWWWDIFNYTHLHTC